MLARNTYVDIGFAVVILQLTTAFNIRCPEVSERYLRSKAWCPNAHKYTCLYDENQHSYNESCSVKTDFQRPGYRVTLRTNRHAKACLANLYQPFIFFTNKSSNCELKKSLCREEGQIVSINGTISTDRQCRCNYAHGYTYVTRPNNICSCVPSEEDCSCFHKRCSNTSHILSPDYLCIDKVRWSGKFRCSSIQELRIPTMTMSSNRQNMKELHRVISVRQKQAAVKIVILLTIVMLLIFSILFILIEDKCSEENAIESQGNDISLLHDENKITESKLEPITQETLNEEIQEILKSDEKAAIESNGGNISLHDEKGDIQEINQEPETQESLDREHQRILEINGEERMDNDKEPILETDVINNIMEKIVSNNCILLLGEPDCVKSALLEIALSSENRLECKFVPCNKPSEIVEQQCESESSAFVINDICGRFVFSIEKFMEWKSQETRIQQLLHSGKVKLLMTCSSATLMTETILTLRLFKDNAFDTKLSPSTDGNKTPTDLSQRINEIRDSNPSAYYSLFLCILKQGYISEAFITAEGGRKFRTFRDDVFSSLNLPLSRESFLDDLPFPMDYFIRKENGSISIKKTSIFYALAVYFGQELQQVFMKYADPEIIISHCFLTTCPDVEVNETFCINVNAENEKLYFKRIIYQLSLGNLSEVFSVRQMKFDLYQMKLIDSLSKLNTDKLNQLSRFKCKFEDATMLTLSSEKTCKKLARFLRDKM